MDIGLSQVLQTWGPNSNIPHLLPLKTPLFVIFRTTKTCCSSLCMQFDGSAATSMSRKVPPKNQKKFRNVFFSKFPSQSSGNLQYFCVLIIGYFGCFWHSCRRQQENFWPTFCDGSMYALRFTFWCSFKRKRTFFFTFKVISSVLFCTEDCKMVQITIFGAIINGIFTYYAVYKCVLQCFVVAGYNFKLSYTSRSPFFGSGSRSKRCVWDSKLLPENTQFWYPKFFLNVQLRNWRFFRGCAG